MPGPQLSGKRPLTLTPRAEQSPAPTVQPHFHRALTPPRAGMESAPTRRVASLPQKIPPSPNVTQLAPTEIEPGPQNYGELCKDFLVDEVHLFCVKMEQSQGIFQITERGFNAPTHIIQTLNFLNGKRIFIKVCNNSSQVDDIDNITS